MIQINDNDSPITAAQKLIHGIKAEPMTPARRLGFILASGEAPKEDAVYEVDMFSLSDIREIADYLLTYYRYRQEDDE
jgi:hypothetical protein